MLAMLAACGGNTITQSVQTERYKVQLTLDGASFAEHTATIEVSDLSGQPATVDQVVIAPVMESMGMASPEQTAQMIAPGQYQVKATFFSMLGDWEFDVRISAAGKEDTARFMVPVQQA